MNEALAPPRSPLLGNRTLWALVLWLALEALGLSCAHAPQVNAWAACEFYCAPYKVSLAMMDQGGAHLGCQCAVPIKLYLEPQPQGYHWPALEPHPRYGPPPRKARRAV